MTILTLESIVNAVKSQAQSAPQGTFETFTPVPCTSVPGLHERFSKVIEALGGGAVAEDAVLLALKEKDAEVRMYQPRIGSSVDSGVLILGTPGQQIVLDPSKIDWEAVSVSFEKDQDGVLNRAVFAVSYVAAVEVDETGAEDEVWDTYSISAYLVEGATEVPAKAYKKNIQKLTSLLDPLVNRTISSNFPLGDNIVTGFIHDSENDKYFIVCGDNHAYTNKDMFDLVAAYPQLSALSLRVVKDKEVTRCSLVNIVTGVELATFGNKSLSSLDLGTYEGCTFKSVIRDGKEKFILTVGDDKYSANTMLGRQISSDETLVEGEEYILDVRARSKMKNGNWKVTCVLLPKTQSDLMANIMKLVTTPAVPAASSNVSSTPASIPAVAEPVAA